MKPENGQEWAGLILWIIFVSAFLLLVVAARWLL